MNTIESLTKKWKFLTKSILEDYFSEQASLAEPSSSWCFWTSAESVKDAHDQINRKRVFFASCDTLDPVFGIKQPFSNIVTHIATPYLPSEKFGQFFVKLVNEFVSASGACKEHMAPLIFFLIKELAPDVNVFEDRNIVAEATRLCNYFSRAKSSDSSDSVSKWVEGLPDDAFKESDSSSKFNQDFSATVDALNHGSYPILGA